jgi:3'(2'), 5'-bisphosphate nucleotidase
VINEVIKIAKEAGEKILIFYNSSSSSPMDIHKKGDGSPVTMADLVANKFITEEISKISSFPIVSEEAFDFYTPREHYKTFWLVDPLDGTKDFIAHNDQFTVNISLIENGKSVLGVVGLPAFGDMYYAAKGIGAFKNRTRIFNNRNSPEIIGADSYFHSTKETRKIFKKLGITNIKKYGSSIKICKIAEGEIDIYPRLNETKEWDTAAGHIILNEAGGEIIDLVTGREMIYGKPSIKNNFFVAKRKGLEI